MSRMNDIFQRRPEKGTIGLELEYESRNPFPVLAGQSQYVFESWRETMDGSLRGRYNMEYVMRGTDDAKGTEKRLTELMKALEGTNIEDSVRAGVHIHLNVQDLKVERFWVFLTCYYILEELLCKYCGEGRSGNHFCLRGIDAEFVVFMATMTRQDGQWLHLRNEDLRYAALNLNSLWKYCSVEFRALRSTTDVKEIMKWIYILKSIKENSRLFDSPQAVIENFSVGGELQFVRAMLGVHSKQFEKDPKFTYILKRGVRLAQELAYATG